MRRTGEAIQWRSRMRTWVGRITEHSVDERGASKRMRSKWTELGTDNRDNAQAIYDRWLETGEAPSERGRELFEVAAKRIVAPSDTDRNKRVREYALPVMGHVEVGRIESHHVASVLDRMAALGKSRGYILKMRSDISQVMVRLLREGAVESNPALGCPLPDEATVDGRERQMLTDDEILLFRARRGFEREVDMALLLSRDLAGERTSDALAHDWSHVNFETRTMLVRRPKTDGETGQRVSERKLRSYELVEHGIPETVLGPLEAWWQKQGSPAKGPLFPLQRDSSANTVTLADGRRYERRGSRAGERKARSGNSFSKAVRRAVWEAGIYRPLPGFDPEKPDPAFCALQVDTETTRRLDFQSMRGAYGTALAAAEVEAATRLALMGHTQETTQTRHYQKRRRVETPAAALPGGKKAPATPGAPAAPATLDAVMAELGRLKAALTGTPGGSGVDPQALRQNSSAPAQPQESGSAPGFGADGHLSASADSSNSLKLLVSPKGVEPMTNALGMHRCNTDTSQLPLHTHAVERSQTPCDGSLPHEVGQALDPLALVREAAARAVLQGDWSLADKLRAVLTSTPVSLPDNVHPLDAARKGKS